MLKHCSPSSVDIRRRSRRNLLTIIDNADVESDIVITDHVYDIDDGKEDEKIKNTNKLLYYDDSKLVDEHDFQQRS